ncbi:MAG: hypothetical protein OXU69_13660, partial [Gemmatimonadota bacterium]|nr:hypothetical protein [Gemmatimonadota bacterium]
MLLSRVLPRRRVGACARHRLQRLEFQRQRDRGVDEAGGAVGEAVGGWGRGLRQCPDDLRQRGRAPEHLTRPREERGLAVTVQRH